MTNAQIIINLRTKGYFASEFNGALFIADAHSKIIPLGDAQAERIKSDLAAMGYKAKIVPSKGGEYVRIIGRA